MNKEAKIFITENEGLIGRALSRILAQQGFTNVITRPRQELDLTDQASVRALFARERPEYVFVISAREGGILANIASPASLMYENLELQNHVLHEAYRSGVKKLLFIASSCIYPALCPQPMKEEYPLTGKLEPTNEPYALAKIAGIKLCQSYNTQYGTDFIAAVPNNPYGINDNFDLATSHVLPALIRKFHDAKIQQKPKVALWGSGNVEREFVFADDIADACLFLMRHFNPTKDENTQGRMFLNIGTGENVKIRDLAETVKNIIGYQGIIEWDTTKPDGMARKVLEVEKLHALGWKHQTDLQEGIKKTYEWFMAQ
jgi:GDP-L-fucose synthase